MRLDARERGRVADADDNVAPSRLDLAVVVDARDGHAGDYRSVRLSLLVSWSAKAPTKRGL
jgi:hypothetical protein